MTARPRLALWEALASASVCFVATAETGDRSALAAVLRKRSRPRYRHLPAIAANSRSSKAARPLPSSVSIASRWSVGI